MCSFAPYLQGAACLSVYQSVSLSAYLSVDLSVCLPVCLSACLPVCLSVLPRYSNRSEQYCEHRMLVS